jgi:O-antigen ligase
VQAIGTPQQTASSGWGPAVALVVVGTLVALGTAAFGPLAALPIFGLLFFALVVARPEYGIALFLSTFLMTYPPSLQGSGLLTINNALGGIFLILLTFKVYREEDFWFLRRPELHILIFILLTFYLSDRFNGPDPRLLPLIGAQAGTSENLRTFLTRTAFMVFFINYIRQPEHVRMIVLLALAFMVITALTGIQGVLRGGGFAGYRAAVQGQAAAISSAANPNRLAMFAILAIAGLYYLMQSLHFPGAPLIIVPTIAVLALSVFMTASRSGLLGLGVCGLVIVIDEGIDLRKILTFGLAALLVGVVLIQFVPEKTMERLTNLPFTQGGEEGVGASSLERRQYTWEIAFELFRENPILGVGIGNWELARFLKDPAHATGAPHSSYLLALCEGGVFCLTGFLLLLWQTWSNLRFAEPYLSDPSFPLANLKWVIKSTKASFMVLVFFSLFADLWQLVIIYWLVGLSIVMRRLVEQAAIEEAFAY